MPPVAVRPPSVSAIPLVVTVPHAGAALAPGMAQALRVPATTLRQLEDPWVDRLVAGTTRLGGWTVTTAWARAVADVNRAADEFAFASAVPGWRATGKARIGLGVVPTRLGGTPIYAHPLDPVTVANRVALAHRPYHDALAALIAEVQARFGEVFVVDVHSMPASAQPPTLPAVDVVVGDRWGAAADDAWAATVEAVLTDAGLATTRNRPYAGGYITRHYGQPQAGVHALQLELRRGLYMDERTFVPLATFEGFRGRFERVIAALAGQLRGRPRTAFALAGE